MPTIHTLKKQLTEVRQQFDIDNVTEEQFSVHFMEDDEEIPDSVKQKTAEGKKEVVKTRDENGEVTLWYNLGS